MRRWIHLVAGAATFTIAHALEASMWYRFGSLDEPAWFLNSGWAAAFMCACLFLAGAFVGAATRDESAVDLATATVRDGVWIGCGGTIAATIVMFGWAGPGTLFPIVIVIGAAILTLSSIMGVGASRVLKRPYRS